MCGSVSFSPIDLIPDFVPVFGYLDDLILLPVGIALAVRLIPPDVFAECQVKAREQMQSDKPVNRVAVVIIIAIWYLLALIIVRMMLKG